MRSFSRRLPPLVALATAAAILLTPSLGMAGTTITVEFAWGGVAVGGVGFFIYLAQSWTVDLRGHDPQGALFEFRDDRLCVSSPLAGFRWQPAEPGRRGAGDRWEMELFRWRF